LFHRLSSSSHCAALSLSCRASWLSHCLSPSFRCATLSSTRRTSLLSHRLSSSSRCTPHPPFILMSCQLVVVLPLDTPPSRCLVVSLCRLSLSRRASWLSCHHLLLSSHCTTLLSCPLIVLAGCCVACPCTILSSSRRSPSPTPSNTVGHCCRHQTPPPLPPLNAVSIVHRCHSCRPSPPSNTNARLHP